MYLIGWKIDDYDAFHYLVVGDSERYWDKNPHKATKFPTMESVRTYKRYNVVPVDSVVVPVHKVEWY